MNQSIPIELKSQTRMGGGRHVVQTKIGEDNDDFVGRKVMFLLPLMTMR